MSQVPDPALVNRELLRQSEERYRLLVESIKDYAIFMLDPQGHILTWNAGAERSNGYTAEEIIGKHFSIFYPEQDVQAGKPARELQSAAAEGRFEDEDWRLRKDGTRFWANVVITALLDAQGTLVGFGKVTRDLTERRRTEEQARQLAAAQSARAEAEAASRRKDQFLAMLAHELRNPLAPLVTGLTLLRQARHDTEVLDQILDMIDRQVRHLRRIIDDLLDVSRLTSGKITLRPLRLDLAALARTTTEDRRPVLERAGLPLTLDTPPTPLWVWGDDARLTQVLANLLDNAIKFTDRGGRIEIHVGSDRAAGEALLTVHDTGIGIPADVLPHIFEPLAQADRSLERTRGGLGLGLAVVRGLVQLHGGRVEAASAGEGRGATFTVHLPAQAEPAALSAPPRAPRQTGQRLRVVVVEDNKDAADSLRRLLEILGHEARVAYTGPEGLQEAVNWAPDVVLSDIGLPGLDGLGLAGELRKNPGTSQARLIALTGYGSEADRRRSLAAGFDAHLVKPADPEEIQRLLVGN
jgi:PAS domain S-box-containing protein